MPATTAIPVQWVFSQTIPEAAPNVQHTVLPVSIIPTVPPVFSDTILFPQQMFVLNATLSPLSAKPANKMPV